MVSLATPYLQVMKGSLDLLLVFWEPLHISGTVEARNFKFGTLVKGSHDLLLEFWDPSISRERLKLEISKQLTGRGF